jgi:hypothetical protein
VSGPETIRSDLRLWKSDFQFLYATHNFGKDQTMDRLGRGSIYGRRQEPVPGLVGQLLFRMEEGLLRLLLPALAAAAVLMFFTILYRLVDDLLVAGVVALIVPMIFLPLFRRRGVH